MLEFENEFGQSAKIKVVGVGGGGSNAVDRMINSQLSGVEFIAVNTDAQALKGSSSPCKLQIGTDMTRGLGSGSNPQVGMEAAMADRDRIKESLAGSDMVFITAGMGGGTGTGAAPVIAEIAKELDVLTVGVVTKPFLLEGARRSLQAEDGLNKLCKSVDSLIIIPNQRLLAVVGKKTSLLDAFKVAYEVLLNAVQGISDLITKPGLINLDFADVRTVMAEMGGALMGTGQGSGEDRAIKAAHGAISSPLLEETSIEGARGILINISGGPDLTLYEVDEAISIIHESAADSAHIIFGAVINEGIEGLLKVTVIATGFEDQKRGRGKKNNITKLDEYSKAFDRPAFQRKEGVLTPNIEGIEERLEGFSDNELDVPTFLRRQMD